jgi:hypothetical protein
MLQKEGAVWALLLLSYRLLSPRCLFFKQSHPSSLKCWVFSFSFFDGPGGLNSGPCAC